VSKLKINLEAHRREKKTLEDDLTQTRREVLRLQVRVVTSAPLDPL